MNQVSSGMGVWSGGKAVRKGVWGLECAVPVHAAEGDHSMEHAEDIKEYMLPIVINIHNNN